MSFGKSSWGEELLLIFTSLSAVLDGHLPTEDNFFFFRQNIFLNVTQKHAHTNTHDL